MAETFSRIPVSPDSELAQALDAANTAAGPVAFDTGETVYELFVSRTQPASVSDDAVARSISGIREAAGSWKGVDLEKFKAYRHHRQAAHASAN